MNELYNGWTNKATWLVNLHFEINTQSDLDFTKNSIEEMLEEIQSPFLIDIIDLSAINWDELSENLEEEEED